MINFKSHIISNTLDGQKTDFKIKKFTRRRDSSDEEDSDYEEEDDEE
jgi:hypothetical protein